MNIVEKIRKEALKKGDIKTHFLFFKYVMYWVPKDLKKKNIEWHIKQDKKWVRASLEAK